MRILQERKKNRTRVRFTGRLKFHAVTIMCAVYYFTHNNNNNNDHHHQSQPHRTTTAYNNTTSVRRGARRPCVVCALCVCVWFSCSTFCETSGRFSAAGCIVIVVAPLSRRPVALSPPFPPIPLRAAATAVPLRAIIPHTHTFNTRS